MQFYSCVSTGSRLVKFRLLLMILLCPIGCILSLVLIQVMCFSAVPMGAVVLFVKRFLVLRTNPSHVLLVVCVVYSLQVISAQKPRTAHPVWCVLTL